MMIMRLFPMRWIHVVSVMEWIHVVSAMAARIMAGYICLLLILQALLLVVLAVGK